MKCEIDPRWPARVDPSDVRAWAWRVEDEYGNQIASEQPADAYVENSYLVFDNCGNGKIAKALRFVCFLPGERVLVLTADGVPFLRCHAKGKRNCTVLECGVMSRVLCGLARS